MLVHSRQQILNNFGPQLHTAAKNALEELGVELHLGERVVAVLNGPESTQVRLLDGKVLHCDTLVSAFKHRMNVLLTTNSTDPVYRPNSGLLSCQGRISICGIAFGIRSRREDVADQECTFDDIRLWRRRRSSWTETGTSGHFPRVSCCGKYSSVDFGPGNEVLQVRCDRQVDRIDSRAGRLCNTTMRHLRSLTFLPGH